VVELEEASLTRELIGDVVVTSPGSGGTRCWMAEVDVNPGVDQVAVLIEAADRDPIHCTAVRPTQPPAKPASTLPRRDEGQVPQFTLPPIDGGDVPRSLAEFEAWGQAYIARALAAFDERNARSLAPYEALLVRTRQADREARQKLATALHAGLADIRRHLSLPDPDAWGDSGLPPGTA
jgi:hypothetical protein